MNRGTCWSVTLNNPDAGDEECINLARQKGWKVEGQLEKGKEGTSHYQLMVRTPQVRFSAVKKQFPRGHIELARNPAALALYVKKWDTREAELPSQQEKYPSLSKYWELIYDQLERARGHMRWVAKHDAAPEEWLVMMDYQVKELIKNGFVVESIAVNPQTRSSFSKFGKEILLRILADRQTDRQCVQIPEMKMEEENKDADDDAQSHSTEGILEGCSEAGTDSEGDEESEASEDEGYDEGSDDSVSESSSQSEE